MRKNICIDFDGVIHSYKSGWCGISNIPDLPVKGAIKWLKTLVRAGHVETAACFGDPAGWELDYQVMIYSSRSKSWRGRRAMKNWLKKNGLKYGGFLPKIKFPKKKPACWLTIDDRAICFKGEFPTEEEIENFKPWKEE